MPADTTPMMAQYLEIKAEHPDALLFYRMGDFYELFFADAEAASAALDIALTKRGKHQGQDIPMCGVPQHSAESYLLTLIRKGFRVAVCEQMESPQEAKKRGSKSVVHREVVRLVTPGTLTEDTLLEARRHNYLAAYSEVRGEGAFAWVDVSTGDFQVTACPRVRLGPMLSRTLPQEVLTSDASTIREQVEDNGGTLTELSKASFDSAAAEGRLKAVYGTTGVDAFGSFSRAELSAMGAIIDYIDITQRGNLPLLRAPVQEVDGGTLQIDAATRRNLELVQALSGGRSGTLLSVIDRTVTAPGARLLETRLMAPSTELNVIHNRLEAVDFFVTQRPLADDIHDILRKTPDMERALNRLALGRGGPRDLAALRAGLDQAQICARLLQNAGDLPNLVADQSQRLRQAHGLSPLLRAAIVEDPPHLTRDGGFIAAGYHNELDETRTLRDQGRSVIVELQGKYAEQTGISSLKIKHNNVLGYFIETTAVHASKMLSEPLAESFIHRQTTANAVRFTTLELSELETRILNAGARTLEIEKQVFEEIRNAVVAEASALAATARALAEIDVANGLAVLAVKESWCRPIIDSSRAFKISNGRHPVVEHALRRSGDGPFVANDCNLTADSTGAKPVHLITGPNMAGKSTYLRQNALIALLGQMGAYVPAEQAHIGLVDQLFSRVGAADDLARGRSTFMVEMVETAAILNQAGPRALVILDEIGRGTSTYDGLSIAWATLEHLHDVNTCRTLFATHYHELTALAAKLKGLANATVAVREWEGDVIFLHEVRPGAADRSYGVQVAKLAGLPFAVIDRARIVLEALEEGERERGGKAQTLIDDLPLFSVPQSTPPRQHTTSSALTDALETIYPDELTPREALDQLYHLKDLLKKTTS